VTTVANRKQFSNLISQMLSLRTPIRAVGVQLVAPGTGDSAITGWKPMPLGIMMAGEFGR